jgi:hypothetical protein
MLHCGCSGTGSRARAVNRLEVWQNDVNCLYMNNVMPNVFCVACRSNSDTTIAAGKCSLMCHCGCSGVGTRQSTSTPGTNAVRIYCKIMPNARGLHHSFALLLDLSAAAIPACVHNDLMHPMHVSHCGCSGVGTEGRAQTTPTQRSRLAGFAARWWPVHVHVAHPCVPLLSKLRQCSCTVSTWLHCSAVLGLTTGMGIGCKRLSVVSPVEDHIDVVTMI